MRIIKNNKQGMLLVTSVIAVATTLTLSVAYVSRAVLEKRMMDREVKRNQAIYTSEAGGNAALKQLDTLINTNLLSTVSSTAPATVASHAGSYVSSNDQIGFIVAYTKSGSTPLLTKTPGVAEAVYTGTATALGTGSYSYTIKITPKGTPYSGGANIWNFPYYYKVQTTGTNGTEIKKYNVQGDFTIEVRKDNFARYALFTNNQTLTSGTRVWFTNNTNFSGPMHTNGRYNFANNPSGTFYDSIKQEDSHATFYNNNNPINLNANANGTIDVPTFYNGFERSVAAKTLSTTSTEANMASEASGGNNYGTNGIYVPNSSGNLTGGIYIRGDADSLTMSVNGAGHAVYTITQGGTTKTITVNQTTNQTSVQTNGGAPVTYNGQPKGASGVGTLIYATDDIWSLGGTVQQNTQVTIAVNDNMSIENNIRYQSYTPGSGTPGSAGYIAPTAAGTNNVLGLISWAGDIRIGESAPNNVEIHGTLMAPAGVVEVENHSTTGVRGTATILGGVISDFYGGFGTFNSATGLPNHGYGRNFVYDQRMETEMSPPYFPTMNTFIAYTDDINDKKFWQKGGF